MLSFPNACEMETSKTFCILFISNFHNNISLMMHVECFSLKKWPFFLQIILFIKFKLKQKKAIS